MRLLMDRRVRALFLAAWLLVGVSQAFAREDRYDDRQHDSYVFSTTRGVNEMNVHPALKLTILPVAVLLDIIFFPFAALADAVS